MGKFCTHSWLHNWLHIWLHSWLSSTGSDAHRKCIFFFDLSLRRGGLVPAWGWAAWATLRASFALHTVQSRLLRTFRPFSDVFRRGDLARKDSPRGSALHG